MTNLCYVLTVNKDASRVYIIEAIEKADDSTLATSRGANKCHRLTRIYSKTYIFKNLLSVKKKKKKKERKKTCSPQATHTAIATPVPL